jgi:hypothetical protein
MLAEDECELIESLIGTGFVATQTEIAAAVTAIQRIHARASRDGYALRSSDGSKSGIMDR